MRIYEKPEMEIKKFETEDIMTVSEFLTQFEEYDTDVVEWEQF